VVHSGEYQIGAGKLRHPRLAGKAEIDNLGLL
jgi:hypothetical protein